MISIVIPVFNEEANLPVLHERLVGMASCLPDENFEFVFVDDCSGDQTAQVLESLRSRDDRLQIIRFSRNCGAHAAVAAGLFFCRGEAAIKMAADLQDPPELIPDLITSWRKGFKVVWGKRTKRSGESLFVKTCSRAFYLLMNYLTSVKQPSSGADIALLDRVVINALIDCREKNASNNMLITWLGFSQTYVEYDKDARHSGRSKWTLSKKIKLFIDSLISFSYVPLRLMSFTGLCFSLMGLAFGARIMYRAVFYGYDIVGWSSTMIAILVIGGFQMIMLGMLGEYLWRTYDESRGRPMYVVESNTYSESYHVKGND